MDSGTILAMHDAEPCDANQELAPESVARLRAFVDALLRENEKLNLTAVRDPQTAWRVHVLDSLALLPLIRQRACRTLLDLGSGGGVPGLPLACALPQMQVTLLDSTQKKIAACGRIADAIGLTNVSFLAARAEDAAHQAQQREQYDAVTARAVTKLPQLIEWTAGFIHPHGVAWLFKTPAAADVELSAAQRACELCRMKFIRRHAYRLPDETDERIILEFDKTAPLPVRLPRPATQSQQRPL